jgi:Flp pilus assembly protein TadD
MSRRFSVPAILLPLLGSCSSVGAPNGAVPSSDPRTVAAAEASASGRQEPVAADSRDAAARELAIWRDPLFQKRFAESYLAESDIEPQALTEDEFDVMQQVLELRSSDQVDKAIALMQGAAVPSANATFFLTLGKLLIERERIDEAKAAYLKAVEKHPKFRRAWNDLGLIHYRQGDYRGAVQAFVRVIELGGASPLIYGLLGFSHASNDDSLSAESAFRMAAMLDPATPDWRMGLAHSFFKQRRFAEAASLFGALIANQPDRGEFWLRQAQAYLGMGEARRAAENLEELLAGLDNLDLVRPKTHFVLVTVTKLIDDRLATHHAQVIHA